MTQGDAHSGADGRGAGSSAPFDVEAELALLEVQQKELQKERRRYVSSAHIIITWLLHNLVEASFDLFRYLLPGDQLKPWELHPLVSYANMYISKLERDGLDLT